jgi:hypothetical protein
VKSRLLRAGLGALLVVGAAAVLVRVFAGVDLAALGGALAHAGRLAPLALLPFLAGMTADALGMQALLYALGRPAPLAKLLPIRAATEALHMTAPAGFVVADTATAALVDAHCGVPLAEGAVLVIARKWLVMRAHAAYILLGGAVGSAALAMITGRFLPGRWAGPVVVAVLALVPLGLSTAVGVGFAGRSTLARVHDLVERVPWVALRERARRWRAGAVAGDALLARVGGDRRATWLASLAFLGCWLAEAFETALVLWLVGGPFDLPLALAVETGVSLVRSVANVAPAGLGMQEAGYATLLTATGTGVDTAAAFVLLKRCKELLWIATGYGLLAAMRRSGVPGPRFAGANHGQGPIHGPVGT